MNIHRPNFNQAAHDLIIRREHGFQVDHIGLCVPDTEKGVGWLEDQTGAKVRLAKPKPEQWYWSGGLNIAKDSFLEVVGPNPEWLKFHPIKELFKSLPEPQILFWYVSVSGFEAYQQTVKAAGGSIKNIQKVNLDRNAPGDARFISGFAGSGLVTQRPNIIQWLGRPAGFEDASLECSLTDFHIESPQAHKINKIIDRMGVDIQVEQGPSKICITLDTPQGALTIENEGIALQGAGMILKMIKLWLGTL